MLSNGFRRSDSPESYSGKDVVFAEDLGAVHYSYNNEDIKELIPVIYDVLIKDYSNVAEVLGDTISVLWALVDDISGFESLFLLPPKDGLLLLKYKKWTFCITLQSEGYVTDIYEDRW